MSIVVNDSYPIELFSSQSNTSKSLFWASAERFGSYTEPEFVDVTLGNAAYFNRVMLKIAQKPCVIELFTSASDGDDWVEALTVDGIPAQYVINGWAPVSSADTMLLVEFDLALVQAKALRIQFTRLDIPLSGYESFPYSIDVSDLTIQHVVSDVVDYPYTSDNPQLYQDTFGNSVTTDIVIRDVSSLSVDTLYWMSQPNAAYDAVEYIILDISNENGPSMFDTLDITPVVGGCQMNLYVSDDAVTWTPVQGFYTLRKGVIRIPKQTASFLKLEFANLTPIPYVVVSPNIFVETRKFPLSVKQYQNGLQSLSNGLGMDYTSMLLGVQSNQSGANLNDTSMYQQNLAYTSNISFDVLATEAPVDFSSPQAFEDGSALLKFYAVGTHDYDVSSVERTSQIAYVVAISDIKIMCSGSQISFYGEPFKAVL